MMPVLFRYAIATCVFICGCLSSKGQRKPADAGFPTITLRTNPLSFLEADGNVMLGLGIRVSERWGAMADAGYLCWRPYAERQEGEKQPLSGIKIRADIRYFLNAYRRKVHIFAGTEFHFKSSSYSQWENFGFNCIGGNCDYFMRSRYNIAKSEIGVAAKFGMIFPMGGDRLSGEVFTGIGVKLKKYVLSNLPAGGSFLDTPGYDDILVLMQTEEQAQTNTYRAYPLIPLGIKLLYRIR